MLAGHQSNVHVTPIFSDKNVTCTRLVEFLMYTDPLLQNFCISGSVYIKNSAVLIVQLNEKLTRCIIQKNQNSNTKNAY